MEDIIKIAIYVHAFFGGLGLITGMVSIIAKKGSVPHKKAGKVFSISMLISCLISLVVARMPNHENLFLFLIGLFTIYLVLSGNRALTFRSRSKTSAEPADKIISGSMLMWSLAMLLIGTYYIATQGMSSYVLFLFFGGFGLILALRDFQFFKQFKTQPGIWVLNHISKMVGALIASITAFIIAGIGIGTLIAWIAPSVLGTIYIIYWKRKMTPKKVPLK